MLNVNNKDSTTKPVALLRYFYRSLWTHFTPCYITSIVNFKHVITSWNRVLEPISGQCSLYIPPENIRKPAHWQEMVKNIFRSFVKWPHKNWALLFFAQISVVQKLDWMETRAYFCFDYNKAWKTRNNQKKISVH